MKRGRPSHTLKSLMVELLLEFPTVAADHEHYFGDKYEVKLRQIRDKAQKAQDKTEQLEEKTAEWIEFAIVHKTLRVVETLMRMQRNYVAKQSQAAGAAFMDQWSQNQETRQHNLNKHTHAC